ncbi:glycine betaine ABC transporter substrate-binding protein [Brevibacillus sp. B_LB10_24]|uniref:ABC transporter substrate-binding protein n=1 Tax=Brevibacillus sp. B_LB10_24 TaxID=3380645 RepID=UPI0038B8B75E
MKPKRAAGVATLFLLLAILLVAGQDFCQTNQENAVQLVPPVWQTKASLTLGTPAGVEQMLLMKLTSILLKEQGYRVEEMTFADGYTIRNALERGYIDLYWEYTNTARIIYQEKPPIFDPQAAFERVAEEDRKKGMIWLAPSHLNNAWAIIMKEQVARILHIKTISDLVAYAENSEYRVKFAATRMFTDTEKGFDRLKQTYGFSPAKADIITLDNDLLGHAVLEANVDVAVGWVTYGKLMDSKLVVLEDDRHMFPPYHIAPVMNEQALQKHPELRELLQKLTDVLTEEKMRELNYRVSVLNEPPSKVARIFLTQEGLIPSEHADPS